MKYLTKLIFIIVAVLLVHLTLIASAMLKRIEALDSSRRPAHTERQPLPPPWLLPTPKWAV